MCGIAGIIHPKGQRPDRSILAEMVAVLNHRGPDENGIYIDGEVGGDVLAFLMERDGLSFPDALRKLADDWGL